MEQKLKELVDRLKSAYGQRLASVVLYGSAATAGETDALSDLNVLCVVDHVDHTVLSQAEPIFRWWRTVNSTLPILMDREEVKGSTDCFPIEFTDMKERRQILHGDDVIASLEIEQHFYRAQVEYELRSKALKLREQAAGLFSRPLDLVRLCAESVSTFCVLGRHALRLAGYDCVPAKREIVRALEQSLGTDLTAFSELIDIREGKQTAVGPSSAVDLFERYRVQIEALIESVDRLKK